MNIRGWVYVLSNEAMTGLLKVGFSTKDPKLRSEELNGTGLPYDFVVEYDVLVENPRDIEQLVHRELAEYHEKKEFFRTDKATVLRAIRKVIEAAGSQILFETGMETSKDNAPCRTKANSFDPPKEISDEQIEALRKIFASELSGRLGSGERVSAVEQFISGGGKPVDVSDVKKHSDLVLKLLETNGWSVSHDGFKWTIQRGESSFVAYTRQDLIRLGANPN